MNPTAQYSKYYKGCKQIFEFYGKEHQTLQLVQELAELIQAITKGDKENFIEEIADVQVMIDQFIIMHPDLDKEMRRIQLEKVKRQLKRMEELKNDFNKEREGNNKTPALSNSDYCKKAFNKHSDS